MGGMAHLTRGVGIKRRICVVGLAMGLLSVGAAPALSAQAEDDLQAALDARLRSPHDATIKLTTRVEVRGQDAPADGEPFVSSTVVSQFVESPQRAQGSVTGADGLDIAPGLGLPTFTLLRFDGTPYVRSRQLARGYVRVRPVDLGSLWELSDPASALRFPNVSQLEAVTAVVPGQQFHAVLSDAGARALITAVFEPRASRAELALFETAQLGVRTVEMRVDQEVGKLAATRTTIDLTFPPGAIDPLTDSTYLVSWTFEFFASAPRKTPAVLKPLAPVSFAYVRRLQEADQNARNLLFAARFTLDLAHQRLNTYQVTLRELRILDHGRTRFRLRPIAQASKRQVQLVSLGTNSYIIRTRSETGNTYTESRDHSTGITLTCRTKQGTTCLTG